MIRRPPRSTLFPYTTPSDLTNLTLSGSNSGYPGGATTITVRVDPTGVTGHTTDDKFFYTVPIGQPLADVMVDLLKQAGIATPGTLVNAADNSPKYKLQAAVDGVVAVADVTDMSHSLMDLGYAKHLVKDGHADLDAAATAFPVLKLADA